MSEADLRRRLDSVTAELLSTYEEIEALTTVAEIAASTADVLTVGRRLLEEATSLLEADVAFLIYSDRELKGEEPPPAGLTGEERDAMAAALGPWLSGQPRPIVLAPFHAGSAIPHAPDAIAAVPLRCEGLVLGALCLGKRGEGRTFTAGDLKILSVLGSSAATVLLQRKNLDLTRLTRSLEERHQLLNGILATSREVASSLDLDRLLHTLANLSARALGFDRCAVMLDEGARRRLRAVSGQASVDRSDPELRSLERLCEWVALRSARLLAHTAGDGPLVCDPPDAAALAEAHMKLAGARSILVIPLKDDQGLTGVLSFESGAADFVNDVRLEGASILANQATVALRNARLYAEVPFIGLLGPLQAGLARAAAQPRRRLTAWGIAAALLLALLVFGRWDLKVPGEATLLPSRVLLVSARTRGVVREVGRFQEGDRVPRGAVLARLDTPDLDLRFNEAAAREQTAQRDMTILEAQGKAADLRVARIDSQRWRAERENLQARIDEATLRAPVDGVLLTPRLDERVGELLDVGGILCTLAEMDPLRVEIAVRENDADALVLDANGSFRAALKFHAFPEIDYEALVGKVRSSAEVIDGYRSLVAEGVVVEEPGGRAALKPGMTGYARIDAGPRPLFSILLRRPYRFIRSLIWL